jgi:hypothetical protein
MMLSLNFTNLFTVALIVGGVLVLFEHVGQRFGVDLDGDDEANVSHEGTPVFGDGFRTDAGFKRTKLSKKGANV